MRRLPAGVRAYRRTDTFSDDSVPAGLLGEHSTRPGTWGKIVVVKGILRYTIVEPSIEVIELCPGKPGVVEPAVRHRVEPVGEVEFYVEFYR